MSITFGSVTSLLKVYVKTLIMDPKQLEPLLQPNVHGHAYFGWHCWRPSGCLWSSLFPHTTRYSTLTPRKLTKVIYQSNDKFSDIHWDIFSWLSWWVPLVLAPCSLGHSPSLCSGEPMQIGHSWPLSQISMTINIFDTFLDVLIFPPKIQRQSSSILVQTDGPQLEETRQVGDNSCWFVYEIVIWTQPSGPLRLWQCYSCSRQPLPSVVLGSYLGSHLGNWLNFQCGIFVGRLFQSLEEELSGFEIYSESFPQSWPTSLPYTLANSDTVRTHHSSTCFRFVTCWILPLRKRFCLQSLMDDLTLGGVVGVATRIVFKPTSYLTVCTILQV